MAQNSKGTRRRGPGRPFQPGVSGNPGGRPKGYSEYLRSKVGQNGEAMADALHAIISHDVDWLTQHGLEIPNMREYLEAISTAYDRGFGKAPQSLEITGEEGGPVQLIKRVIVDPTGAGSN